MQFKCDSAWKDASNFNILATSFVPIGQEIPANGEIFNSDGHDRSPDDETLIDSEKESEEESNYYFFVKFQAIFFQFSTY